MVEDSLHLLRPRPPNLVGVHNVIVEEDVSYKWPGSRRWAQSGGLRTKEAMDGQRSSTIAIEWSVSGRVMNEGTKITNKMKESTNEQ